MVKLSEDPKGELVKLIVDGLKSQKSKIEAEHDDEKVEALVSLLYASGKGFEADLVVGDWALVFSRQGKKSPRFQKAIATGEKAGRTLNTFKIKDMTFSGGSKILGKGLVTSEVKVRIKPYQFFIAFSSFNVTMF